LFTTPVVYLAFDRLARRLGHRTMESTAQVNAPAD
jgi:hypothetical protein